ncbi:MAG: hypothetical protein EVA89_34450 [Sandaracinaceae bacterium]|nr:MAG: hypothetical protein EVA89_34450 [Sandaracinaceae bacterium]
MAARSVADVRALHRSHVEEHRTLPESARARDLGNEKALVRDYSGRVVYELVQNALDRAEARIEVSWDEATGRLLVGNDGLPVTAFPRPTDDDAPTSDFHALLSLHSSTKSAEESVGNKGVGFRSVFASASIVEVWSHTADGEAWGLRMSHPAKYPDVDGWRSDEVASFYAPELLLDSSAAPVELENHVTVVVLHDVPAADRAPVSQTLELLKSLPLTFLAERARFPDRLEIVLTRDGQSPCVRDARLPEGAVLRRSGPLPVTPEVKRRTGLDLQDAGVSVLQITEAPYPGTFWSYLPTEQSGGLGLHIHADFYLANSRRSVTFRNVGELTATPPSDPPAWNGWLLEHAAKLILESLWLEPEVVWRNDFWHLANPHHCPNEALKAAIGRRLLGDRDTFVRLVRDAFAADPAEAQWTLQRYYDFFEAIEAWARFANNSPDLHAQNAQKRWRAMLVDWIREAGVPILPIVEDSDPTTPVTQAEPVPDAPRRGQQYERRIYRRRAPGFVLPPVLRRQGVLVTALDLPARLKESELGMLELSRPDLLAAMKPGTNPDEHQDLLLAALRVAMEEPVQGGRGSFTRRTRVELPGAGPWYRLLDPKGPLGRAGAALAELHLPCSDGEWAPASAITRRPPGDSEAWPWPVLDEQRLSELLETLPAEARPDLDTACRVLGVGIVPLLVGEEGVRIPRLGEADDDPAVARLLATALLAAWPRDLHPFLRAANREDEDEELSGASSTEQLRRQLQQARWIPADLGANWLGGELNLGPDGDAWLAPQELWLQRPRGGFRTTLLSRLILPEQSERPLWVRDLQVSLIAREASEARLRNALQQLSKLPPEDDARQHEDLYRRLVGLLSDAATQVAPIPVLVREFSDGVMTGLVYSRDEIGRVWHDSGEFTFALAAFPGRRLWSVRRAPLKQLPALGIVNFAPPPPRLHETGEGDPEIERQFERRILAAAPDMLAAALHARVGVELPVNEAVARLALLRFRHSRDVWLEYEHDRLRGELGRGERGDVFAHADADGSIVLAFDGEGRQLAEAARPLSELLSEGRAFEPLFREALQAWTDAPLDGRVPSSVRRFRRDQGLSDAEVLDWAERLDGMRMSDTQRAAWSTRVIEALSTFGEVESDHLRPGAPVTPDAWAAVTKPEATEDDVRAALERALEDAEPPVRAACPRVAFAAWHRDQLNRLDLEAYAAARADQLGRGRWKEGLLEELAARMNTPCQGEAFELAKLGTNVEALARLRFELPADVPIDPTDAARAFIRGEVTVTKLPSGSGKPRSAMAWPGGAPKQPGLTPKGEEGWAEVHRKRGRGGRRAEEGVVRAAIDEAQRWREADESGWRTALRSALAECLGAFSARAEELSHATTDEDIRRALHVAELVEDAGFDILVPSAEMKVIRFVEVKRVASLQTVGFILSEGERRRALDYAERGLPWQLWAVTGDGAVEDVTTAVLELCQSANGQIEELGRRGLRAGEWQFRLT